MHSRVLDRLKPACAFLCHQSKHNEKNKFNGNNAPSRVNGQGLLTRQGMMPQGSRKTDEQEHAPGKQNGYFTILPVLTWSLLIELPGIQPEVFSFQGQQINVVSSFNNLARLQNDNLVRISYGR